MEYPYHRRGNHYIMNWNKLKRRERLKTGRCSICEKMRADDDKFYCQDHRRKIRENGERERRRIKKIVFDRLGRRCVCCGITENSMLTIDHAINIGKQRSKEGEIYSYLIKNNFPDGYSVMCFNCNISKYRLGICAHLSKNV